jgi:hypothetical protein
MRRPLNDYAMGPFRIANISTASQSEQLPAPYSGQVVGIKACVETTISGTKAVLTVRKGASDMSGITLDCDDTAGGDVEEAEFSPNNLNGYIEEGDAIDIDTDGASTTTSVTNVYLIIRR